MVDQSDGENGVEMLRRMISYVRAEANRLHLIDVAILLEHAEEAVVAFAPAALADGGRSFPERAEVRVEH